jgi:hypothetical protein
LTFAFAKVGVVIASENAPARVSTINELPILNMIEVSSFGHIAHRCHRRVFCNNAPTRVVIARAVSFFTPLQLRRLQVPPLWIVGSRENG